MTKNLDVLDWSNPIGVDGSGVGLDKLQPYLDKAQSFLDSNSTVPPFIADVITEGESVNLKAWAQDIAKNGCKHLVVLGTGGSSRGGQSICALQKHQLSNIRPVFFENLGAHSMDKLLNGFDLANTHFLVISKSGSTAETLAQCIVCIKAFKDNGLSDKLASNFTVITDKTDNPLAKIAQSHGFKTFEHPKDLGGRYSVLSVVGIAPAIASGVECEALLSSAKESFKHYFNPKINPEEKQPFLGAALQAYYLEKEDINQTVLMPYDSRLVAFSRWFQQLWAESIGKEGGGTTPSLALGPIDQHSQLQLFLQGPRDKFFTIITEKIEGQGQKICSQTCDEFGIGYLSGHTIGDLVSAEAKATIKTLQENNRPLRVIQCSKTDENALGQLFAHFMMETILMAHMLGVDPYNQPAVERGKQLTRKFLRE